MKYFKYLFFVLLGELILTGCPKPNSYPVIPYLEFKNLEFGSDGTVMTFTLTSTFTDGDGDVGYYSDRPNNPEFDDISSDFYYNYVIELQVKRNNTWMDTVISYTDINFNSDTTDSDNDTTIVFYNDIASTRIPYLTPDDHNKGLNGDINKTAYLPSIKDTIRFKAFIYDRNKHQSNIIFTPGYFVDNQ